MLISAALADGVLTDKEREILMKRAVAEGIDPDEFEMVLDARVVELQKRAQPAAPVPPPPPAPGFTPLMTPQTPQMPSTQKYGEIRKCPHCGAVVETGTAKCQSCGYEFVGIEANSSAQRLAKKLEEVSRWIEEQERLKNQIKAQKGFSINLSDDAEMKKMRERANTIKDFPIPNTKEDLLEFVVTMRAKWKNSPIALGMEREAYKSKYYECIHKIKLFFANDPAFKIILDEEKKDESMLSMAYWQEHPLLASCLFFAGMWLVLFIVAFIA